MDYIINGQANGGVASALLQHNMDPHSLRPFIGKDKRAYITVNQGGILKAVPVMNANATLLKDEWKQIDDVVIKAALPRLRAAADLRGRGLTYTIPNGMSKSVLQSQNMSDINPASVSMDGITNGPGDRPVFDITNLPLPIIHKDFSFTAREIAVSRSSNQPLDTTMAEAAARKVAEGVEQSVIGTSGSYQYGGGAVYGMTNYPNRITKTLSSPLLSAWVPRTTLLDVLDMRELAKAHFHFGPFILYVSTAWDKYMDDDLSTFKGDGTLRDRIRKIDGISDVVTLDFLKGYDAIMLQTTSDVMRLVIGMDITTVQWETHGGMEQHFKVMCIMVPQLRRDANGNTGIVHGSVSGQTNDFAQAQRMPAFSA